MPWTDEQHAEAVTRVRAELVARFEAFDGEADLDPRVVDAMALENSGTDTVPRGRLRGARIDRALRLGRHERWSTIIWRIRLAERLGRAKARRAAQGSDDPLGYLEAAGIVTREEAEARADALRAGTPLTPGGNRAQRRAAARRKGHR